MKNVLVMFTYSAGIICPEDRASQLLTLLPYIRYVDSQYPNSVKEIAQALAEKPNEICITTFTDEELEARAKAYEKRNK